MNDICCAEKFRQHYFDYFASESGREKGNNTGGC